MCKLLVIKFFNGVCRSLSTNSDQITPKALANIRIHIFLERIFLLGAVTKHPNSPKSSYISPKSTSYMIYSVVRVQNCNKNVQHTLFNINYH